MVHVVRECVQTVYTSMTVLHDQESASLHVVVGGLHDVRMCHVWFPTHLDVDTQLQLVLDGWPRQAPATPLGAQRIHSRQYLTQNAH